MIDREMFCAMLWNSRATVAPNAVVASKVMDVPYQQLLRIERGEVPRMESVFMYLKAIGHTLSISQDGVTTVVRDVQGLSDLIFNLRNSAKIMRSEFAPKIGCSMQEYDAAENEPRSIGIDTFLQIIEFFHCEIDIIKSSNDVVSAIQRAYQNEMVARLPEEQRAQSTNKIQPTRACFSYALVYYRVKASVAQVSICKHIDINRPQLRNIESALTNYSIDFALKYLSCINSCIQLKKEDDICLIQTYDDLLDKMLNDWYCGCTQGEVAISLGCTTQNVSYMLRKKSIMSVDTFLRLVRSLEYELSIVGIESKV